MAVTVRGELGSSGDACRGEGRDKGLLMDCLKSLRTVVPPSLLSRRQEVEGCVEKTDCRHFDLDGGRTGKGESGKLGTASTLTKRVSRGLLLSLDNRYVFWKVMWAGAGIEPLGGLGGALTGREGKGGLEEREYIE